MPRALTFKPSKEPMIFHLASRRLQFEIILNYFNTGGVYRLIGTKNGRPLTIGRLVEKDFDGTLYIGQTKSFLDRIEKQLKMSLDPYFKHRIEQHICGKKYKAHPSISKKFKYDDLYVELIYDENPIKSEKEKLLEYKLKYGEVPPLNA